MARTLIGNSTLVRNGSVAPTAGTALDATNHHYIAFPDDKKIALLITNTYAGSKAATVKAGPWSQGNRGDLTVTLAQDASAYVGPFESSRFKQANGNLNVDLASGMTGTITAIILP